MRDNDILPEYDLNKLGYGVRGKHAEAMRQGYSVTVYHDNGTFTTRYVASQASTSNDSMHDGLKIKHCDCVGRFRECHDAMSVD